MNEGRKEIIQIAIVLVGIIFLIKLFFIQVLDSRYAELADSNAILSESGLSGTWIDKRPEWKVDCL